MSSTEGRLRESLSAAADSVRPGDGAWAQNAERVRRDRRTRRVVPAGLAVVVLGAGLAIWRIPDWSQEQSPAVIAVAPTVSPSVGGKAGGCGKQRGGSGAIFDGMHMSWTVSVDLAPAEDSLPAMLCYRVKIDRDGGSVSGEGAIEPTFVKGREFNAFPYLGTTGIGDTSWVIGAVEEAVAHIEITYSDGSRGEATPLHAANLRAFVELISSPDSTQNRTVVMLTALDANGNVLGEVGIADDSR